MEFVERDLLRTECTQELRYRALCYRGSEGLRGARLRLHFERERARVFPLQVEHRGYQLAGGRRIPRRPDAEDEVLRKRHRPYRKHARSFAPGQKMASEARGSDIDAAAAALRAPM